LGSAKIRAKNFLQNFFSFCPFLLRSSILICSGENSYYCKVDAVGWFFRKIRTLILMRYEYQTRPSGFFETPGRQGTKSFLR